MYVVSLGTAGDRPAPVDATTKVPAPPEERPAWLVPLVIGAGFLMAFGFMWRIADYQETLNAAK